MQRFITIFIIMLLVAGGPLLADDDHLFTVTELELVFTEAELVANDSQKKGFTVLTLPSHGDLTFDNGQYHYWSDPAFAGWDSFTYQTARTGPSTVWIFVSPLVRPLALDWDGDAQDELGYYNSYEGRFYLCAEPTNGQFNSILNCEPYVYTGTGAGWIPLVGDWNGDGTDQVGLYEPQSSQVRLFDYGFCPAPCIEHPLVAATTFQSGSGRQLPVAGNWFNSGTDTVGFYDPDLGQFSLPDQHPMPTQVGLVNLGGSDSVPYAIPCSESAQDTPAIFEPSALQLQAIDGYGIAAIASYSDVAAGWGILTYEWGPGYPSELAWFDVAAHGLWLDPPSNSGFFYCFGENTIIGDGHAGSQLATMTPPPVRPPPR